MSVRWIYVAMGVICFALGIAAGFLLWGRVDDSRLIEIRALAERATQDLDESQRFITEARGHNRELAAANRELTDALGRAERRNNELTGSLREAEESLKLASGDASELTELLDRIFDILETLFEGSGGGDPLADPEG